MSKFSQRKKQKKQIYTQKYTFSAPSIQTVIIAGGKGTRMGGLTASVPKSMLKIGNKPVIEHQIEACKKHGIKDFYIIAGHLAETICDYFKNSKKFAADINCLVEKSPLGTAGAVKMIEKKLKNDFLVIYGDMFFDINLTRLIDFHMRKKSDLTPVVHLNDYPYDCDLVEVDTNCRIKCIHKKPHGEKKGLGNLANTGIYIFNEKVLSFIEKDEAADIAHDVLPLAIRELKVYAYITRRYVKDIGTPLRFAAAKKDFLSMHKK
jgi:NDP-sugar pyrophosphorylase family protein